MKLPKAKSPKKAKLILSIIAVIVSLGAIVAALELTHIIDLYKKPSQEPTEAQKNDPNTGNDKTTLPENGSSQEATSSPQSKPDNPESPSSPVNSTTLSITIVRAGQSGASQPIAIRAFTSGAQSGKCRFTFTAPNQTPLVKEVATRIDPTYVSCEPVDIPSAEFPASGNWQMEALFQANGKSSPTINQTVQVTK